MKILIFTSVILFTMLTNQQRWLEENDSIKEPFGKPERYTKCTLVITPEEGNPEPGAERKLTKEEDGENE